MIDASLLMCLKCSFIVSNINLPPHRCAEPPFQGWLSLSGFAAFFLLTYSVICLGKLLAVSLHKNPPAKPAEGFFNYIKFYFTTSPSSSLSRKQDIHHFLLMFFYVLIIPFISGSPGTIVIIIFAYLHHNHEFR